MRNFLKWAFDSLEAPEWVVIFCITTIVAMVAIWVAAVIVLFYMSAEIQGTILFFSPFVVGGYLSWKEYKRQETDE